MDTALLKQLGNLSQIAGIREAILSGGRGNGLRIAEFYNSAGLRFTVCPDRCMDLLDFSYRGVNIGFNTKNGAIGGAYTTPLPRDFCEEWSGGMLATCGLDNVGGGYDDGALYPTHGRIGTIPAERFGTRARWEGDDYVLCCTGEMHQTRLYGRHLLLSRTIRTTLKSHSVQIHDELTNMEPAKEPFMLLYHTNFGYPILSSKSVVYTSPADMEARNALSVDPHHMMEPVDDRGEELYSYIAKTETAFGAVVNPSLHLGAYIRFKTGNLPRFQEWKNMRSHDYVLAVEPCNCHGDGRAAETATGSIAVIPGYSTLAFDLEIGVMDGQKEIDEFLSSELREI